MPRGVAKKADTVDWNAFVHESDPEVNSGYTEATKAQIRLVKTSFQRYVARACWDILLTYKELDLRRNFSQETMNIGFGTSH